MKCIQKIFSFFLLLTFLVTFNVYAADTLWFPHVACSGGWETEICILNTDDSQSLTGILKPYNNSGAAVSGEKTILLLPHARKQIIISDEFPGADEIGYVVLEIASGNGVGFTKFYIEGRYRVAVPAVSKINSGDIYIPHIASDYEWWTGISLVNTTSSTKTLSFEFNNGTTKNETLDANEHKAFVIKSMFGGTTPQGVESAVIRNAAGVIGLELFGSTDTSANSYLSGILLKDDTAMELYYPHIASDANWWTGIVAYNPLLSVCSLSITSYSENGTALGTQTRSLDGRGKYIGMVNDLDLPDGTAWFGISASSPVTGFELFGTNNGKQLAGYTGVNINGNSGVFAKREQNGNGWTGIAFVNIENSMAKIILTAYDDNGNIADTETITLNPHEKKVDMAEDLFSGDISSATCIGYVSDKEVVGFQLNGSEDGMLLDGLPGLRSQGAGNTTIWYKDMDGDGYSDGTTLIAETRPAGYYPASELTAVSGDSNDNDPSVNPGNSGSDVTLQMTYTVPSIQVSPTTLGDDDVQRINFGSAPLAGEPGEPVLPVIPARIMLPDGFVMDSVEVTHGEEVNLAGSYEIEYGQQQYPLLEGIEPTLTEKDMSIYGSDDPYPGKLYDVVGIQKLRGISILLVNLHPVEYNPLSGKVTYYKDMSVKVTSSQTRKRSAEDENVRYRALAVRNVNHLADNPEVLETYKENNMFRARRDSNGLCDSADSFQYVLVTSQAIKNTTTSPNVNDLIAQRKARGMSATIVTIEDIYASYSGTDQAEQLRNFIIDAYNNWETDFVLLGGDTNIIPTRKLYCEAWSGATYPYADKIPSDLYYQCLDGTFNFDGDGKWGEPNDGENGGEVDLYAELYVGRASAEDAKEMANFVYKTLAYENNSSSYKKRALMCGELLWASSNTWAKDYMEEIRLGISNHGYTTSGFESDSTFSVDVLYEKDQSWDKYDIIEQINSNQFSVINHLGHANYNYVKQMYNYDTNMLNNSLPVFAYSQGCVPGNFEEDCIAERLTTSTRYGMFAVVYNSRYGWGERYSTDGASQRYNREFWDAYFSEGYFYLGAMNADSHEDNAWRIDKICMRWCYYESNLLGDPATAFAVSETKKESPVADAGADQTVSIDAAVTLNASGSSDADGTIVSYFWEQTEGSVVTINNASSVQANFSAPDMGTSGGSLKFRLTVTDNDGLKDTDECTVNVEGKQDDVVYFPDANLEAAIRDAIEKPSGDILKSDLQNLFSLKVSGYYASDDQKIEDLEGIECCTNLNYLYLNSHKIRDIGVISGLNNLSSLNLPFNQLSDINAIAGLTNLKLIYLYGNQISDISALAGLTNLAHLNIGYNQISDISVLSGLNNLKSIIISDNKINDISAISGLIKLTELNIGDNQISNISALKRLTKLYWLQLYDNQISDISALSVLNNLEILNLSGNQISNISPLVSNSGIDSGDTIYLYSSYYDRGNPLSTYSCTVYIPQLESRGVTVHHDCP